jgi:hypothetical protein
MRAFLYVMRDQWLIVAKAFESTPRAALKRGFVVHAVSILSAIENGCGKDSRSASGRPFRGGVLKKHTPFNSISGSKSVRKKDKFLDWFRNWLTKSGSHRDRAPD